MIPLPSVPTDSLYKFQALGGIFAIFVSVVLYVTQAQAIVTDYTKLDAAIKLTNLKIDKWEKNSDRENKLIKEAGKELDKGLAELKQDLNNLSSGEKIAPHIVNSKSYSTEEYSTYLVKNYHKASDKFRLSNVEFDKFAELYKIEEIELRKQISLQIWNAIYLGILSVIVAVSVRYGTIHIKHGFNKWQEIQEISNEITRLQLEKARKDVEGDKPKLILPD